MEDTIREAPIGQVIRYITHNKFLKYPEEVSGFELPEAWVTTLNSAGPVESERKSAKRPSSSASASSEFEKAGPNTTAPAEAKNDVADGVKELSEGASEEADDSAVHVSSRPALEHQETKKDHLSPHEANHMRMSLTRTKTRDETQAFSNDRLEVEQELAITRTKTIPIVPQITSDGNILVDWYTTDDVANPQNWSQAKKAAVSANLMVYTFTVYTASAIYTPSVPGVIEEFGVSVVNASLPLSLYVLAYGIGPLFFGPMSEIPIIGRNPVYIATMFMFTIISVGPPLVPNFAGLLVLRFLQGFFGSPCLANGGATMQDMYSLLYLPYALSAWVSAAYCGPALGPLLSGFAVPAKGWRWSLWEILWLAAPVCLGMFLFMPETSTPNILLRRAKRLRALTGDNRFKSQSEIDQAGLNPREVILDALIKPIEITIKDPAIAFVNLYTALVYGIYYSFFEVFPLVYPVFYGFSSGIIGVIFLCILVSCFLGIAVYCSYLNWYLIPDIMKHGLRAQEHRLVPALFGSFGPPIGLFIFAWTARPGLPWIASVIGITIYGASVFIVMQCIFVYVPLSYPQYAASLFAGNDFFRSALACGSIMFAHPLFINLGVDKGTTLLACLSTLGIIGIFYLYYFGASLRSRSSFAQG